MRLRGLVGSDRAREQAEVRRKDESAEENRVVMESHEKPKDSLVDPGVHDPLAKVLAHDMIPAKHAKPEDHLGS